MGEKVEEDGAKEGGRGDNTYEEEEVEEDGG